jgi:hypothetical protein
MPFVSFLVGGIRVLDLVQMYCTLVISGHLDIDTPLFTSVPHHGNSYVMITGSVKNKPLQPALLAPDLCFYSTNAQKGTVAELASLLLTH